MLLLMHIGSVGHRFCCCLQWCCDIISPNIWCCTDFAHKCGGVVYLPQIHSLLIHLMLMLPCCLRGVLQGCRSGGMGVSLTSLWIVGVCEFVAEGCTNMFMLSCSSCTDHTL